MNISEYAKSLEFSDLQRYKAKLSKLSLSSMVGFPTQQDCLELKIKQHITIL